MIMLIGQMLGCLFIAAGIGGAVGWLLRHLSAKPLAQQCTETTAALQLKDQAIEKLRYELKAKIAAHQMFESTMLASDSLQQANQQELASAKQRLAALEDERAALLARIRDHEAAARTQSEEVRTAKAAVDDAQETLRLKENELRPLQDRFAILENLVEDTDRLRARIKDLEPAQGRIHWLEVQLSERETQHRTALHDIERQLAERERRIQSLEPLQQQLQEQTTACESWKTKYTHAMQQITDAAARSHDPHSQSDALQTQLMLQEKQLREKTEQLATLQQQLDTAESAQLELADMASQLAEKEEEIARLRTQLVESRAALQIRTDGGVAPRPIQPSGNQLILQIAQPKPSPTQPKDDLKKIRGIGPAFERELNKLGIATFQQVAQWDADMLQQIAAKLDTAPARIIRDKWIVKAKKLHEQKYGERL